MPTCTLAEITDALAASWSAETCDPADREHWSPGNPARGQCGVSALVLHDLLGGELVLAEVVWPDGARQGHHYWNRLPDGREVDLTVQQFVDGERVLAGRTVVRPPGPLKRCADEYDLLRRRVLARLEVPPGAHLPGPAPHHGPEDPAGLHAPT